MDIKGNEITIYGLVIFIEVTSLYIIKSDGKICLINGEENQIKEFKLNEYYEIKKLYYIPKDDENYILYDMTKDTLFKKSHSTKFLKNYAIIKFIILDEIIKEKNPQIKILDNPIKELYQIKGHIEFFSVLKNDDSTYFIQTFQLIINGKVKSFDFFLYKKQINTINCSLREDALNNNKSFEIIYLSKNKESLPEAIEVSNYKITNYDIMNCSNRKRYNIMNVRNDNDLDKFNTEISSLLIIYLLNNNKKKIKYGVFDLKSINKEVLIDYIIDKNVLKFLNDFWYNYKRDENDKKDSYSKKYYNLINNNLQANKNKDLKSKLLDAKKIVISKYNKNSLDNEEVFVFFRNYYFYLFLDYVVNKFNTLSHSIYIEKFFKLLKQMELNKYSNYDKIRILDEFKNIIFDYSLFPILIDINQLDNEDPYYLAIELQKEIINHITEESNIFFPILQLNSKILKILPDSYWSYLKSKIIKKNEEFAYTISLEDIEDMKSHLMTLQENFFFIIEERNELNFNGIYNAGNKITTINQYILCKGVNAVNTVEEKKGYSFSICMAFCHERMGHKKEIMSNSGFESPSVFFNKYFEKDYISKYNEKYGDESGRILESFIASKILIKIMKEIKKFGEFLNYKYFIKDFEEINKKAILLFQETELYVRVKSKIKIFIIIKLIISILPISLLLCIIFNAIELSFNNIIKTFLIIILFILSKLIFNDYQKLYEPYKYNDDFENNNEKDEVKLIFPKDYPMEQITVLEKLFPCLYFKKNKIRRKLNKYICL